MLLASPRVGRGAGIYFYVPKERKMLLVLRSNAGDFPGTWCGCGGGIDGKESPRQAAVREAFEELGYSGNINLLPLCKQVSDTYTFYSYLGVVDAVFIPTLNHEHTDYMWIDVDDFSLDSLNLHPSTLATFNFIMDKGK